MSTTVPLSRGWMHVLATLLLLFVVALSAPAQAQKAALTRDVDNPALQPFRTGIFVGLGANETTKFVDGPTVPAGKRLVVENVSVWALGAASDFLVTGVWLTVPGANPPTFVMLDPNNTERKLISGSSIVSAYNRQVTLYYNAGETVQAQVFIDGAAGVFKQINIYINGYLVNL